MLRCVALALSVVVVVLGLPVSGLAERTFEPAPEVVDESVRAARLERALGNLSNELRHRTPTSMEQLMRAQAAFAGELGLWGDLATAGGGFTGFELDPGLGAAFDKCGLAAAAFTCFEKYRRGEPVGMDVAVEGFKFFLKRLPGGGVCGPVFCIVNGAFTRLGERAVEVVGEKYFDEYRQWQLAQAGGADALMDLLASGQESALTARLDAFWRDEKTAGLRGEYFLRGQDPGYQAAMAGRFLNELLLPLLQEKLQAEVWGAEIELNFRAQAAAAGFVKNEVRILVPNIIEQGTGGKAKDLRARLVRGDKYLVAECRVAGNGADFKFPAARLIDPASGKRAAYLTLHVDAQPPATARSSDWTLAVRLDSRAARTTAAVAGQLATFTCALPLYVEPCYDVAVAVEGEVTSLLAVSSPARGRTLAFGPSVSSAGKRQGTAFLFEKLPTGHYLFTGDFGRVGEADVTGPQQLSFTTSPPAVSPRVAIPTVSVPDWAGLAQRAAGALRGLREGVKLRSDVLAEAAMSQVELLRRAAEVDADFRGADDLLRRKRYAVDKMERSATSSQEQHALYEQVRQEEETLRTAQRDARERRTEALAALRKERDEIERARREEDSKLSREESAAQSEVRATVDAAQRLADELDQGLREVFREQAGGGSYGKAPAQADQAIAQLEATASGFGEKLKKLGELEATAKAQRQRLDKLLEERLKRAVAAEEILPSPPEVLERHQLLQSRVKLFQEQRTTEQTAAAMARIKERHEARKRNDRELQRLVAEAQALLATLPAIDGASFDRVGEAFAQRFAALLTSAEPPAPEALAKLAAEVDGFLASQAAVCGSFRCAPKRTETNLSRVEGIFRKCTDLQLSRAVHQIPELEALRAIGLKVLAAREVCDRSVFPVTGLEADVVAASKDFVGYRAAAQAARVAADAALAQADGPAAATSGEPGALLAALDAAWTGAATLPGVLRKPYEDKVHVLADRLVASGALERYAAAAGRPLIVFASYYWCDQADGFRNPTPLGKALFRGPRAPSLEQWRSVVLNATVAGLPTGAATLLEVGGSAEYRAPATSHGKGGYTVAVTNYAPFQRVRLLVSGTAAAPICYPWLRQVVFE